MQTDDLTNEIAAARKTLVDFWCKHRVHTDPLDAPNALMKKLLLRALSEPAPTEVPVLMEVEAVVTPRQTLSPLVITPPLAEKLGDLILEVNAAQTEAELESEPEEPEEPEESLTDFMAAVTVPEPEPEVTPAVRTEATEADYQTTLGLARFMRQGLLYGKGAFEPFTQAVQQETGLVEREARRLANKAYKQIAQDETVEVHQATMQEVGKNGKNGHAPTPVVTPELESPVPPPVATNAAPWLPVHDAIATVIAAEGSIKPEEAWELATAHALSKAEMREAVALVETRHNVDKRKLLARREAVSVQRRGDLLRNKNGIPILPPV